jgi:hypothetical protein
VIHPTSVELSFGSLKPPKKEEGRGRLFGSRSRPGVTSSELIVARDVGAINKLAGIGGEHGLWSRCIAVRCATSHHNSVGTVLASLGRQKKGP